MNKPQSLPKEAVVGWGEERVQRGHGMWFGDAGGVGSGDLKQREQPEQRKAERWAEQISQWLLHPHLLQLLSNFSAAFPALGFGMCKYHFFIHCHF